MEAQVQENSPIQGNTLIYKTLSMNYNFEIAKNEAQDVFKSFLEQLCSRYNTYMLSYVWPEGPDEWISSEQQWLGLKFYLTLRAPHRENCALKWPLCWTEKQQIYTWFMWECHLLVISSTITHFTDLLQSHRGKSRTGSLFCSSHPGTSSCSWSAYHCRGHKDHLHWKGCGSVAWSDLTGSSGLQWLGLL